MSNLTIYRIKSDALKVKGEKYESADRKRAEARLRSIQRTEDPNARLLAIPSRGR